MKDKIFQGRITKKENDILNEISKEMNETKSSLVYKGVLRVCEDFKKNVEVKISKESYKKILKHSIKSKMSVTDYLDKIIEKTCR